MVVFAIGWTFGLLIKIFALSALVCGFREVVRQPETVNGHRAHGTSSGDEKAILFIYIAVFVVVLWFMGGALMDPSKWATLN